MLFPRTGWQIPRMRRTRYNKKKLFERNALLKLKPYKFVRASLWKSITLDIHPMYPPRILFLYIFPGMQKGNNSKCCIVEESGKTLIERARWNICMGKLKTKENCKLGSLLECSSLISVGAYKNNTSYVFCMFSVFVKRIIAKPTRISQRVLLFCFSHDT